MLGSDLRPDRPVAQIISLAEIRRGRQEQAALLAAGFRVGDAVVSRVELARGPAEIGAQEAMRLGMIADAAALRPRGGQGVKDPRWRAAAVGETFVVADAETKFVTRTAAYYRRYYNLQFSCRKTRDGVLVERKS